MTLFLWDGGLQVLMKDMVTPVPPEEVKGVIRKCLEQAAQLNYQRIKEYAKIEGNPNHGLNVSQRRQFWKMLAFLWWSRAPLNRKLSFLQVSSPPSTHQYKRLFLPYQFTHGELTWDVAYLCPHPKWSAAFLDTCDGRSLSLSEITLSCVSGLL